MRSSNIVCCYAMPDYSFEWDPRKATSNAKKHGVRFEEARTVFDDEAALVIRDPDHSEVEERFIILGESGDGRVLIVVHCFRSAGGVIRIISARRAGTKEQKPYWDRKS